MRKTPKSGLTHRGPPTCVVWINGDWELQHNENGSTTLALKPHNIMYDVSPPGEHPLCPGCGHEILPTLDTGDST